MPGDPLPEFEWDPRKAARNASKHRVTFEEAATVFSDPSALSLIDPDHADEEDRFVTFGYSDFGRLIVVAHVDRENRTRIISARRPTRMERRIYEEG